ncbi:TrwN protein [Bartonella sp. B1099]|uniref:TrwN protein n=1 Tax=Bartonella sp. B1099 TaxID=2911422 RepID=UPI0020C1FBC6|nr:TrwN protein [Bartonella sp. B1099]
MIVPDFTIFTTPSISNPPLIAFSTLFEQERRDNFYITGNNDKLFCPSSPLREEIATTEQFKQNKHNFDAIFEQIDVQNMKWFFLFEVLDSCRNRNLAAIQSTLTYCYEQTTSKCIFEKATLQSTLSFYNTENLNSGADTQTVASYIGVKTAMQRDKDLREPVRLKKEEPGQTTKVDSLPLSSEELGDVFMRKESSNRDAFAAEDSSSSINQLE